jgi:hypothetical protein
MFGNVRNFSEVANCCFHPIRFNKFKANTTHLWDVLAVSLFEENYAMKLYCISNMLAAITMEI